MAHRILRIYPDAVRGAVVGKVAIGCGEAYAGSGLSPSGNCGKHGNGHRLAGTGRPAPEFAGDERTVGASSRRGHKGRPLRQRKNGKDVLGIVVLDVDYGDV